jgi:hypothetical protein
MNVFMNVFMNVLKRTQLFRSIFRVFCSSASGSGITAAKKASRIRPNFSMDGLDNILADWQGCRTDKPLRCWTCDF